MKTSHITTILTLVITGAFSTIADDTIKTLSQALNDGGITNLAILVSTKNITSPGIPSKWYVDNRLDDAKAKAEAQEIRDFGLQLAKEFDQMSEIFQKTEPDDTLFELIKIMSQISDWCGNTSGYGNIFLAERALDIAAVGLVKLAATTKFPFEKLSVFENIVLQKKWDSVRFRGIVLDYEIGSTVFSKSKTNDDLQETWGSGALLYLIKNKKLKMNRDVEDIFPGVGNMVSKNPVFQKHVSFFKTDINFPDPSTVTSTWDYQRHEYITSSIIPQSIDYVADFLKFRTVIGSFPPPWTRTAEEEKLFLEGKAIAEKFGSKVNRIEDDPGFDPVAESFRRAWRAHYGYGRVDYHIPARAAQVFNAVKVGKFYDQDTRNIMEYREINNTRTP